MTLLARVGADLLDLVLPVHCVHCAAPGAPLCRRCATVPPPPPRAVPGVGAVHSAGEYEGALRAAVLRYKERGRRELAGPLAEVLAPCLERERPPPDALLVPIVSARGAARARGGDHLVRLVRMLARRAGRDWAAVLRPDGRAVESVGLGVAERRRAVRGSLRAAPAPPGGGRPVVLVDDVITTGATLGEAGRVLRAAGWPVHGAVTVLAVPGPSAPAVPLLRTRRAALGRPAGEG